MAADECLCVLGDNIGRDREPRCLLATSRPLLLETHNCLGHPNYLVHTAPIQVLGPALSKFGLQTPLRSADGQGIIDVKPSVISSTDFDQASYFHVNSAGAVAMVVRMDGSTTPGSHYPRSELHQMDSDRDKTLWDIGGSTVNRVEFRGSTQRLPKARPMVCIAQIKCPDGGEPLQLRVESDNGAGGPASLKIRFNDNKSKEQLTDSYSLGSAYTFRIESGQGEMRVSWNGGQAKWAAQVGSYKDCNFKVGNYAQSNEEIEGSGSIESEVWLTSLDLGTSNSFSI